LPDSLAHPMPDTIFSSSHSFKQQFIQELKNLTTADEVGVFILVLANAISKPEIYHALSKDLSNHFTLLKEKLNRLPNDELKKIPTDDLSVFEALSNINFNDLSLSISKLCGVWQLQYNPLRSFRPARNSDKKITRLYQAFDNNSFHFNKIFLSREILWQGNLANIPLRLLYNKFPFADYHGLLVIEPELKKPQFLQQQDIVKIQQILSEASHLQGIGLAYNSLGAYASVNHQHWQMFLSEQNYPVEHSVWTHNSGSNNYPLGVECFHKVSDAWPLIDSYQQSNCSFNLLVRPDKTYLIKRKKQGEYQHSHWTSGFAWSEIMGNIMTTTPLDYGQLTAHSIEQEFKLLGGYRT
jgi:hypothetical protein